MSAISKGTVRLFQVRGIEVSMHWSWLVVAFYQIGGRANAYSSIGWRIAEYLALFFIVLLHEFGHALACRQVGGRAERIMLWPLGGVAYIAPPQRPGALLWSIAAGPLVNVLLIVPLGALMLVAGAGNWEDSLPNAERLVWMVFLINGVLLIFNLLPIYPLDGGQIVRALLWFLVGKVRSLFIAVSIGGLGALALIVYAFKTESVWTAVIAGFVLLRCRAGWKQAQTLSALERGPRRAEFSCPRCHASPPVGARWGCSQCRTPFDTFEMRAECPRCATKFPGTQCLDCGQVTPFEEWKTTPSPGSIARPELPDVCP